MPNNIKVKANVFEIEIPLRERSSGITKKTASNKLIYAKTKTCMRFNKDKISDFEKVDNIQEIKGVGSRIKKKPYNGGDLIDKGIITFHYRKV